MFDEYIRKSIWGSGMFGLSVRVSLGLAVLTARNVQLEAGIGNGGTCANVLRGSIALVA